MSNMARFILLRAQPHIKPPPKTVVHIINIIMANRNDISIGIELKKSNLVRNCRIGYTNGSVTKNKNLAILLSSSGENHDINALPNIRNCMAYNNVITNLPIILYKIYINKSP